MPAARYLAARPVSESGRRQGASGAPRNVLVRRAGTRPAVCFSLSHKDRPLSFGGERALPTSAFRLMSGATAPLAKLAGAWVEIVFVGIRLCDRLVYASPALGVIARFCRESHGMRDAPIVGVDGNQGVVRWLRRAARMRSFVQRSSRQRT